MTIDSPTALAEVAKTLTVMATITDDVGVVLATLLVDGVAAATTKSPPWTFPVQLQPGQRKLEVRAEDAAGNTGSASVTVTVTITEPGTKGAQGDPCRGPDDCQSGLCAAWGTTQAFCTQRCGASLAACPPGWSCESTSNNQSVCAPAASAPDVRQPVTGGCTVETSLHPRDTLPLVLLLLAFITLRRRPA